jgi:hypothetical protein
VPILHLAGKASTRRRPVNSALGLRTEYPHNVHRKSLHGSANHASMGKQSEPPKVHKVASGPTRPKLDIASVVMAVLLVLWGASGLVNDKLVIGKGSAKIGFTNGPAWLVAAALICGAAVLLITALPPAAKELKSMSGIRWLFIRLGWCLLAAALVSQVYLALTQ